MSNHPTTDAPAPLSDAEIEQLIELAKDPQEFLSDYREEEQCFGKMELQYIATLDQTRAELVAAAKERDYWKWIAEVAVVFIDHDAPESAKQALKEPEAMWREWFNEGKTPFDAACAEMEAWDEG